MATVASIIKQYGAALDAYPDEHVNHDVPVDLGLLAHLYQQWGVNSIGYGEDEILRDNLGLCPRGRQHWWKYCDSQNCK